MSGALKPGKNLFAPFGASNEKTDPRKDRLAELKSRVTRGYMEATLALKEIKESGLWELEADSWTQFCTEQLHRSARTIRDALQLLQIAEKAGLTEEAQGTTFIKPSESTVARQTIAAPALIANDLRKIQRTAPEIPLERKGEIAKNVLATKASLKDFDFEAAFRKEMDKETGNTTPAKPKAQELREQINKRLRKADTKLLMALIEWLDNYEDM